MRRVAAHELVIGEERLQKGVVEIMDGRVVNYYTFDQELPMTEWLGGVIEIRRNEDGILEAFQHDLLIK